MRTSLLVLVLALSACTIAGAGDPVAEEDGSGMPTPEPDPDPDPDPGPDPDPDPDPDPGAEDACPPSDIGIVDALKAPTASIDRMDPSDPDSPAVRLLHATLDPSWDIEIGLWDGYGAFADAPAAPGEFAISGADADPSTCGVCVELTASGDDGAARRLFAVGGSIAVTSLDGTLEGSGQTLSFKEVDDMDEVVAGGCAAQLTRVVFDVPLEPF